MAGERMVSTFPPVLVGSVNMCEEGEPLLVAGYISERRQGDPVMLY